ncbi:acyltransferase family protein [Stutzerimonas stutzeri]|uniref:Acyltransferase n=1 Tax=Stutzerimonas stutzeri TaxID=316 RepID=A0A2N8RGV2_STUST|nr:acyltransferase [Stutzerimonas stutzeri]MCQ4253478.1 acyltransferase [Stutzerimonas stutzeri]PNF60317.1 acyltransferase [Stutzerimonas stutzeri]
MRDAGAMHGKNRNIQFLRGLAIVMVLLAHASVMLVGAEADWWDGLLQRFLPGVGVDLFFLISGYLMGATFLRNQQVFEAEAVYVFYKKRIRRVLLPTWFWAAVVLLFSIIEPPREAPAYSLDTLLGVTASAAFFLANVFNGLHETDFGYFWSIALEVQFYVLFPLLLLLGRAFWPAVIGIVLWFSFANPFAPEWLFRANGLFMGLLLWKLSSLDQFRVVERDIEAMTATSKVLVIGLAVVSASILAIALEPYASFRWAATTLVLAVPFMLAACSSDAVFGALSRPFEAIGQTSFSLYLCHIPVWLLCMSWLDGQPLLPRVAVCVTMSLIVAGLSYRYIERPLMDGAKSAVSARTTSTSATALTVARAGREG